MAARLLRANLPEIYADLVLSFANPPYLFSTFIELLQEVSL